MDSSSYLHFMDASGEYMEWPSLTNSFSAPCLLPNEDSHSEFMQFVDPPSCTAKKASPLDEDDDDDSLDCSVATPHQFYFPTFEQYKENYPCALSASMPIHPLQHAQPPEMPTSASAPSASGALPAAIITTNITPVTNSNALSSAASSSSSWSQPPSLLDMQLTPSSSTSTTNSTNTLWTNASLLDHMPFSIPRSYVSLSDVNAFVAKADSIKHSESAHLYSPFGQMHHPGDAMLPWDNLHMMPSMSSPTAAPSSFDDKLFIKIPKHSYMVPSRSSPMLSSFSYTSSSNNDEDEDESDDLAFLLDDDTYVDEDDDSDDTFQCHQRRRAYPSTGAFLPPPPGGIHSNAVSRHASQSSLSSTASSSSSGKPRKNPGKASKKPFTIKKGRNVDKACNHCKRSHLRCDDMRPCRRCIATGKTGCKDVQHKPRGRPKLHKK